MTLTRKLLRTLAAPLVFLAAGVAFAWVVTLDWLDETWGR